MIPTTVPSSVATTIDHGATAAGSGVFHSTTFAIRIPSTIPITAPSVLSVAVDMGMLNRTTKGQFVTFRGTPAGMAEAMFGWKMHSVYDTPEVGEEFVEVDDENMSASDVV